MDENLTSARVVFVLPDNTVVMTKGDSDTIKFFGGKRDGNETMIHNAVREVRNESSLDLDPSRFIRVADQRDEKSNAAWFVVRITEDEFDEIVPGEDVRKIYRESIESVQNKLTHDPWKRHWEETLKDEVLLVNGISGRGEFKG